MGKNSNGKKPRILPPIIYSTKTGKVADTANLFKKEKIKNARNKRRTVERDKMCKSCGRRDQLTAHHIIFVSEGGDDRFENLITLCFNCHRAAHDGYYYSGGIDHQRCMLYVTAKDFMLKVLYRINDKLYEQTLLELEKKSEDYEI